MEPPASVPALLQDPPALRRHMAWLDAPTARRPGEADATLAGGWLKLADGIALAALSPSETYAVLADGKIMRRLVADDVLL